MDPCPCIMISNTDCAVCACVGGVFSSSCNFDSLHMSWTFVHFGRILGGCMESHVPD